MFVKDCAEEFRLECDLRRLSPRTTQGYFNNVMRFLNFLENQYSIVKLRDIKTLHIKRYVQYLNGKNLQPTYINGVLKSLRAFFKFAVSEEYIEVNPAQKVNWQREGVVIIETFTDDEVRRMLNVFHKSDYLSVRNKLLLALAFDTGVRVSELCQIEENDIKGNVILIHGKGNKERHVPLTTYVRKMLVKYDRVKRVYFMDKIGLPDNLLLSRCGRPLTKEAVEQVFRQTGEMAKVRKEIRCSPHTARHYYAQTNLRNGLDVYSLSRLLGHENINITKRYLQSLQDSSIVDMAMQTSPLYGMKP